MTGILADTVAVDCCDCGLAMLAPLILVTNADGCRCHQCQRAFDEREETKAARIKAAQQTGERRGWR